jgi:hypothetical protein
MSDYAWVWHKLKDNLLKREISGDTATLDSVLKDMAELEVFDFFDGLSEDEGAMGNNG